MNKRGGVVNVDRISDLPEALILQILCLLPTKEAIAISVLSKQWRSHWKMMPQLKFNSLTDHRLDPENVCKSLLSNKAPVLQSLHLQIRSDKFSAVDTGILIGIAITRNVRDLVLQFYYQLGSFTLPRCLYNCETLETLELKSSVIFMDVPSSVCLKSLRTLHLHSVEFKDAASVGNLLSGCPKLEDFMVLRNPRCTMKTFTIAVPSLQKLSINNDIDHGEDHWRYVIKSPSLKYFKVQRVKSLKSCLIENVPELVEASISNVSNINNDKLMGSLLLVKRLSLDLSSFEIKFPTSSIFYKLVYLELFTNTPVLSTNLMLDTCPKLKVLKIIDTNFLRNCLLHGAEWNQPKNVPECLLLHLETFMWAGYKWRGEEEREVAKYILKNANRLKRATFSSNCISDEDKLEVVNDLKSVVWASSACQFQFR